MKKDFENLVGTLKNSIKTWDYFVNWEKVLENKAELEIALNKLNYLLGKEDLKSEFVKLYEGNPDIVKALPVLLAVRESELEIFDLDSGDSQFFDFENLDSGAEKYFEFIEKSGLAKLFKEDGVKNLVDYVLGVEVGLDSNGRKNRGGKLMEKITKKHISEFCEERGFEYKDQATAKWIKENWDLEVQVNKTERSFDFAIFNSESKGLKLVEVNFYNGGGSKLKAVCGEFKSLYNELERQNIDFIWITDGLGWHTAKKPLEETYNHNKYVFNLNMLENGVLEELDW